MQQATEGIRGHVERLKALYGSGIKALDDLSGELDKNSLSTFGILNSQVQMHSSTLEDVRLQLRGYDRSSVLHLIILLFCSASKAFLWRLIGSFLNFK